MEFGFGELLSTIYKIVCCSICARPCGAVRPVRFLREIRLRAANSMGNSCQGQQKDQILELLAEAGDEREEAREERREILKWMTEAREERREILKWMTEAREERRQILKWMTETREERRRIETNARKSSGNYFVTTCALWNKKYLKVEPSFADAVSLIAEKIREFPLIDCSTPDVSHNADGGKLLIPDPNWCLEKMRNDQFNGFQKDWNIFFTSVTNDRKDNAPGQKSLAHSVPVDGVCSVFWPPYLELLTGSSGDSSHRFYAVHGRVEDETQYRDIKYKGIKNVEQNLLALPPDHGASYDGSGAGNLIIIPIVDLEKSVNDLNKNKYDDLLVVGRSKSIYHWIYNGAVAGTANIFYENLDATVEDANEDDIRIATKFLEYYAKAASHIAVTSVKTELEKEMPVFEYMYKRMNRVKPTKSETSSRRSTSQATDASEIKIKQRISSISKALEKVESDGICVPEVCQHWDNVLKVKLKKYFEDVGLDLSLYPSWGLLGLKATANWLVFADQPLIPAGLDPETFPVPSIDIDSSSHASDLNSDEPNDLCLGSVSHAI